MVVVFVGCLCCCGLTCNVTSSVYVKNGTKSNPKEGLGGVTFCPTLACTIPIGGRGTGGDDSNNRQICTLNNYGSCHCPIAAMGPQHTTISKHTMQQDYVVRTRKIIIVNVN
jgi:hypothetical protein